MPVNNLSYEDSTHIMEFRERLLSKMQDFNIDFENYLSSQYYLDDLVDPDEVSTEFLINKGSEFIEHDLSLFGISTSNEIYSNFYTIDTLVNIYNFLQPKILVDFLSHIHPDTFSDIKTFISNYDDDNLVVDFFEYLHSKIGSGILSTYYVFSSDFLGSNITFNHYLKRIVFELVRSYSYDPDYNVDSDEGIETIKEWNKKILTIMSRIVQIQETEVFPFKDSVIHYIYQWLNKLQNSDLVGYLMHIHFNNAKAEKTDSSYMEKAIQKYRTFRKVTFGYPEYIINHDDYKLMSALYSYISKLDPAIELLNWKDDS